jgi:hypothetical protein
MTGTRAIGGRTLALTALVSSLALAAVAAPVATGHPRTSCAEDAAAATRAAPPWVNIDAYLRARQRTSSEPTPVAPVRAPRWVNIDAYLRARQRTSSEPTPVAPVRGLR